MMNDGSQAGGDEHEREHRRGRGLAVGAGDRDGAPGAPRWRRGSRPAAAPGCRVAGRRRPRGWSSGIAVETATASTSRRGWPRRGRRRRRRPGRAAARATASRLRSLPVTAWPIEASTVAIALMPAPPMPTTWMRCGVDRSIVDASATAPPRAFSSTRRPRVGGVGMGGAAHASAIAASRSGSASRPSTSSTTRWVVRLGVGHDDRRARRRRAPARWRSGGRAGAIGSGTSIAGSPTAASSATCCHRRGCTPGRPRRAAGPCGLRSAPAGTRARRRERRARGAGSRPSRGEPITWRIARSARSAQRSTRRAWPR